MDYADHLSIRRFRRFTQILLQSNARHSSVTTVQTARDPRQKPRS